MAEREQLYDLRIVYGNTIMISHVKKLRKKLYAINQRENVSFVHGTGNRKSPLQKSVETLEGYLCGPTKYDQKIHICRERNSYSKTDHDATFMRMKEDAMGMSKERCRFTNFYSLKRQPLAVTISKRTL